MKPGRLGRGLALAHLLMGNGEVYLELVPSLIIGGSAFPIAAGIREKGGAKNERRGNHNDLRWSVGSLCGICQFDGVLDLAE